MTKSPILRVLLLTKTASLLGLLGLASVAQDWEAFGPGNAKFEDIIFDDENFIWAGGGK